ncbi:hypothetical protein [Streptomyces sp. NPDC052225]|uniref:hypothetical protein n=1 Tax=Streptomyces sp. NPDC052225 TaxID=3154949 RepID=UPI0034213A5D
MPKKRTEWADLRTALVIAKDGMDACAVSRALELPPPGHGRTSYGPGQWAHSFTHEDAPRLSDQIDFLALIVLPRIAVLENLRSEGYVVEVAVSGVAATGCQLPLTRAALEQLRAMTLPVSFTVLTPDNRPAEDPLSWLV